jgi:uncharacterized protein YuzE
VNKQIVENYDSEADTLYVTFGTGEPSYAEEIDDVFVVEMGMFSRLPTGFRVINFSEVDEIDELRKFATTLAEPPPTSFTTT